MPVPSTAADLSTTAASNSPQSGDAIGTSHDDYMRATFAIIKQQDSKGADIASSTTIDVPSSGKYFVVTGTTTIAGISDDWHGRVVVLKFSGALQLTHSSSFILPGAANITTADGDVMMVVNESTGVWRAVAYQPSSTPVSVDPETNGFRLTLTSGSPVTASDVTGATTVYCTPYKGARIALYDGSRWNVRTSAEFSLALGTLTSGRPYDVFCYDNSGTPTLEFLAWTNDTARATGLAYQNGVLVKSGAATRRYLGTFYTTSTTETEDSAAKRFLWNYYHRIPRQMRFTDATATWAYTTATLRQANGNAANQLDMVIGVVEDVVTAETMAMADNSTGGATALMLTQIGLDSTTAGSSETRSASMTGAAGAPVQMRATFNGYVGIGRHYLSWLEFSSAVGTTTWRGTSARGIYGVVMA